ncbi:ComF family protein [Cupriavidus sp. DF5525]|uniref:ComF family protein n=1 Tax=Cupriavidus sp. DF5525 TaxID=3160989 RepID=UPI0032DF477C
MQGHGQTGQQEDQEAAQVQARAPGERGRLARWAAAGRQVYARAALAARSALALGRHFSCPACAAMPPAFDHACTLGDYASPQDQLVLALKFGQALPLAGWLAARLAAGLPAAWSSARLGPPDLVAPIPLSPQRLAARGFNQAWEIARPLARGLGLRADPVLLQRKRDTGSQRALDLAARQVNLRDAFRLARPARLDGLHVALVDDVMTSGTTLHEAARVLKAHGAAHVSVIVALRTP